MSQTKRPILACPAVPGTPCPPTLSSGYGHPLCGADARAGAPSTWRVWASGFPLSSRCRAPPLLSTGVGGAVITGRRVGPAVHPCPGAPAQGRCRHWAMFGGLSLAAVGRVSRQAKASTGPLSANGAGGPRSRAAGGLSSLPWSPGVASWSSCEGAGWAGALPASPGSSVHPGGLLSGC